MTTLAPRRVSVVRSGARVGYQGSSAPLIVYFGALFGGAYLLVSGHILWGALLALSASPLADMTARAT